uniref:Integral membrane protein 2 n=1 Tax=Bos mutus grunniens TaxID=30521 RepID=A0A8B9WZS5_BOSMU
MLPVLQRVSRELQQACPHRDLDSGLLPQPPPPTPAAEILLTPAREERPPIQRYKKGGSVGGVCYLSMGMVVLLMGLVFASVYIYRYFFLAQLARDNFFHCGVLYEDSLSSQAHTRMELEEDVKIYLEENYERINVPVPQFGGGDPADIIHDFQRGLTAYHDISLDKCYVIELNTTIVLPPRNFWELLMNVKRGTYLPQTYIIQEEMVVTEHVSDKEALGSFIYHLCSGKDTYRLRRRATRRRINKREAKNCNALLTLLSLYFGRLPRRCDVSLPVSLQPCPPPCTRAVTSQDLPLC